MYSLENMYICNNSLNASESKGHVPDHWSSY